MSLTDSHHYHHGQKPTMVGICHGGNLLGNHDVDNDDDDDDHLLTRPTVGSGDSSWAAAENANLANLEK